MIDLQQLDYSEFEILVGIILKRIGYEILRGPGRPGTRGPDFEVISPDGIPFVVEVKHFKLQDQGIGKSLLSQFAGDIDRYRQQKANIKGLLVLSSPLSQTERDYFTQFSEICVWDRVFVLSQLVKNKDLEAIFQSIINAKEGFYSKVQDLIGNTVSRSKELTGSLRALPCGREHWKDYERLCTEILTYIFSPELGAPDIQSRSDDGLDIIDAIFPIRSFRPPWNLVRTEYRTRFVVSEFKNYCDPIGQTQVESIAQYLWRPAQRFFGLLVSRQAPNPSAIAQRRRKWLEEEKCIVFLNDDNLCEMLQLRESQGQTFDVIDVQLEDFFRTLTP